MAEVEQLRIAFQEAKTETQAVRQKLHNAIRKGKALDIEKQQRSDEVASLKRELVQARASRPEPQNGPGEDQAKLRKLEREHAAMQQHVGELLAKQADFDQERQETSRRAAQQEQELESRLHHAQFLEEVAKTKQRELAAQQGECVMLRAALYGARQETEEARSAQQSAQDRTAADPTDQQAVLLQRQLNELTSELQQEQSRHTQDLQQAKEQVSQSQAALKEAADLEKQLQSELQQARQDASQASEALSLEVSTREQQLQRLAEDLQAGREAEQRLQKELAELQAAHENGDVASEGSAAGTSAPQPQHVEELRSEIAMLHEAMQAAAARIRSANEERDAAQAQGQQRASETAEHRRRVAELEGTLSVSSNAQTELQSASEALHEARGQTDELKRLLQASTQREDEAGKRVSQLEAQLMEALSHGQTPEDVAAAQQAAEEIQQAAASARAEAAAQTAHARSQQEAAAQALQSAEEQVAAAADAARAAGERAAAAEAVAEQLRQEDASRRQRFSAVQQGFSRKLSELSSQVSASDAQAAQHRSSMAMLQQAVMSAQKAAAAAKQEAASADERVSAAVGREQESARRQVADAEAEIASVRQQLQLAHEAAEQLQQQMQEATAQDRDSSELQAELEQEAESAQADAESSRQRASRSEGALQAIRAKVAALEGEGDRLKEALTHAQTQARAVPAELTAAETTGRESGDSAKEQEALQQQNDSLKAQVASADKRVAAAAAVQHARVAAVEKANQDLSWQVAMLTRGGHQGEAAPQPRNPRRGGSEPDKGVEPGRGTWAGIVGWVLRHRRALLIAYLALLHILIYQLALSSGGSSPSPPSLQADLQESQPAHVSSRRLDPGRAHIAGLEALAEAEGGEGSLDKEANPGTSAEQSTAQSTGNATADHQAKEGVLVGWDDVAQKTGGSHAVDKQGQGQQEQPRDEKEIMKAKQE